MTDNLYRHGDVILKRIDSIPEGAEKAYTGNTYRLAEGEITGHFHEMTAEVSADNAEGSLSVWEMGGVRFLTVASPAKITHQEHGEIAVAPGTYRIDIEREHDPMTEQSRRVID